MNSSRDKVCSSVARIDRRKEKKVVANESITLLHYASLVYFFNDYIHR